MNKVVEKAILLAKLVHKDDVRKYTGEPYFTHVERVANKVASIDSHLVDNDLVAAAYLHDTVEDHPDLITFADIKLFTNGEVSNYVFHMTNLSKRTNSKKNRQTRKEIDRFGLSVAPLPVKLLKAVDRLDNLYELDITNPFSLLYAKESLQLMDVLKESDTVITELIGQNTHRIKEIITYHENSRKKSGFSS